MPGLTAHSESGSELAPDSRALSAKDAKAFPHPEAPGWKLLGMMGWESWSWPRSSGEVAPSNLEDHSVILELPRKGVGVEVTQSKPFIEKSGETETQGQSSGHLGENQAGNRAS